MAQTPVEVRRRSPARTLAVPWDVFRNETDRLFGRFTSGFAFPSMRRMLDMERSWRYEAPFKSGHPQ